MWRLFEFFGRFGNAILFVLLELLALVIVFTFNEKQSFAFQKVTHEIGGQFSEWKHSVSAYFFLNDQNLRLQSENAKLNQDLVNTRQELAAFRYRFPYRRDFVFPSDSLQPVNIFDFIPCRAVNSSTDKNYNYITLNKGSRHGITKYMGVITPAGVAGMVISVSPNYSLALSLLNKDFNLSARVRTNRNIGTLSWNGGDPSEGTLEFIPQTSPLNLGDTVLTSGFSGIYPEDFMVGVVTGIDENNHTGFYNIRVKFATDFRRLDQVYIVRNNFRNELDTLEASVKK